MRKKSAVLVAILASLAVLAVAAPKIEVSWKNPTFTGDPGAFKNILVLALNGKAANRTPAMNAGVPAGPCAQINRRKQNECLLSRPNM